MDLIHGECLEKMKDIPDKSVDFVFMDLPFGQTACKWDIKLDLDLLWIQLKRIARNDRTPFFFSCTTKFGFELIKANEKWFRWDLVWKKNRAAGFLNAYKLPMRKHEMVYCFAKKSPEYDVSSHKEYVEEKLPDRIQNDLYGEYPNVNRKRHNDPLPTSDITPPTTEHELVYCFAKKSPEYDVSSHKEGGAKTGQEKGDDRTDNHYGLKSGMTGKRHKDPLPTSDITPPTPEHELVYCFAKKSPEYDVSSHKTGEEVVKPASKDDIYLMEHSTGGKECMNKPHKGQVLNEPLPTSDITQPATFEPSSWCEFKNDEKTGHRTAKPVALMEFLLKYWTKPDATVLDPTMGSGSMGIACKRMGRKFIGIEMDRDIYDLAQSRISNV